MIDVSGFTALSERLGRKGKEGAEELTVVIGDTFARLLVVAYRAGGSLLKFGGDALFLHFAGDGHAPRACGAAAGMRAELRALGPVHTTAGSVRLRMSVGVHSGDVHFFLAGRTHRELVVSGPAVTRTLDMEAAASAGQVLVSPETAALLPARAIGAGCGPGFRLVRPPDVELASEPAAVPDVDASALVPDALRDLLGQDVDDAEHRPVTVAFLKFAGLDGLGSYLPPEEAGEAVDDLLVVTQEATAEHGVTLLGSDVYPDGGKLILLSGAPRASTHDEQRMLLAVRSIFDRFERLPLTAGIHAGHVFAGSVGPPYRRTYTVMGDVVNTAARIMGRAEKGQILCSPGPLERSSTVFHTTEIEPFFVKGKTAQQRAAIVGPVSGGRDEREHSLPFVGREELLGRLLELWSQTESAGGAPVLVTGDAGSGKSRLVHEFAARLDGVPVLEATCHIHRTGTAYDVLRQIMQQAAGFDETPAPAQLLSKVRESAPHLEPWLPLVAVPFAISLPDTDETRRVDPSVRKQRIEQLAAEFVGAVTGSRALVVVDRAGVADTASADALTYLARWGSDRGWVVLVVTRRPDSALARSANVTVAVGPLSPDDGRRLAVSAAGGAMLPQQASELARRSGGNPLFLQELVSQGDADTVPASLEAFVSSLIDALRPKDRAFLRRLAVLGPEFPAPLAQELGGDLGAALAPSRLGRFVERNGSDVRFRRVLFQEVAYEGLPYRSRRSLHDTIGLLLEDRTADPDGHAEILSFHFDRARDAARSWRYSLVAARRARNASAHPDAVGHYRRALDAGSRIGAPSSDRVRAWLELGESLHRCGRLTEAADSFRSARRLSADGREIAHLYQREGAVHARMGARRRALMLYARGLKALEEADASEGRWRLTAAYAAVRREQGRLRDALRWAEEAMTDARTAGEPAALGHAYNLLHMIYADRHDERAWDYGRRALEIFEGEGLPGFAADVLNNLGTEAKNAGRWDEALDLYTRSRCAQEAAGKVVAAAVVAGNTAVILSDQGKLEEARQVFADALSTFKAAGFSVGVSWVERNLGQLASRAGDFDEAESLLRSALASATGPAAHVVRAWTAENLLFQGRFAEAAVAAESALAEPGAEAASLHRTAGYAAAAEGDLERARACFAASVDAARLSGSRFDEALSEEALGRLEVLETGRAGPRAAAAARTLRTLGVVSTPRVPVPGLDEMRAGPVHTDRPGEPIQISS